MKPQTNTSFLRPLLNVLRVRKWIVLAVLILVPASAALASSMQAAEYEASSQVLISRSNLSSLVTGQNEPAAAEFDFNRVVQTQANLARTPRVAKRTLQAAGMNPATFEGFLGRSSVTTSPNNDLLTFTVTDATAGAAVRLAGEYARQFVGYKQATTTRRLRELADDLEREYTTLDPKTPAANQNRVQYGRVRNLLALDDSSVSVVQTPTKAHQTKPQTARNIILGIIFGGLLGIGLAFLRDALDTRLRGSSELEEALDLPLLGRLPSPPRGLGKDRLATLVDPASPDAEHFRVLRSGLMYAAGPRKADSILITSAVPAEGKSTTIANLAVAIARAGQNVVLADFDFRRPALERFFDLPRRPGAIDVVLGNADLEDALQPIDLGAPTAAAASSSSTKAPSTNGRSTGSDARLTTPGTLRVLTTGDPPPTVGEFITGEGIAALVKALGETTDVLLIDSPPLLAVGDAIALSDHVDAILYVARLGLVRRHMLDEVQRVLAATPTPVLGLVITDSTVEAGRYDGYGYGYPTDAPRRRSRFTRGATKPAARKTEVPPTADLSS